MKKLLSWGLALLFGASMLWVNVLPAWAAEESMAQSACPWNEAWSKPYDISGLVGAMVLSQNKEELGRVLHVTESVDGGTNFLIVSSCLPGMDGRLVAIPYRSFNHRSQRIDSVTLNLSTQEFKDAPSFSRDLWPHETRNWAQDAYRYFEKTPYFG